MSSIPALLRLRPKQKLDPAEDEVVQRLLVFAVRQIRDGHVEIDAVLPSLRLQDTLERMCDSGLIDDQRGA